MSALNGKIYFPRLIPYKEKASAERELRSFR